MKVRKIRTKDVARINRSITVAVEHLLSFDIVL